MWEYEWESIVEIAQQNKIIPLPENNKNRKEKNKITVDTHSHEIAHNIFTIYTHKKTVDIFMSTKEPRVQVEFPSW